MNFLKILVVACTVLMALGAVVNFASSHYVSAFIYSVCFGINLWTYFNIRKVM
jgi:hypothetical protein